MPNSTFMPQMKNEATADLASGVKVRIYRNEPFKFMGDIHAWLAALNIGEIQAFHMNTDANGWVNFAIAYRESPKEPPIKGPDPVLVLYDTAMALKELTEVVDKMREKLFPEIPLSAA